MRLIDADKLIEEIEDYRGDIFPNEIVENVIPEMPTVDAQPVVHAKWIYEYQNVNDNWVCHCSNCGATDEHATDHKNKVPYCWKCGARMYVEGEGKI